MQIRPLSPWSRHGKENLKYFTPVARKPATFLVKSYGKIDLLLNGAISVTSEVLRNLQYVCQVMETLGWPQLPPGGCLAPSWAQGCTPQLVRLPPCCMCYLAAAASPSLWHPDRKSHGVRIKDGRALPASLLCKAEHILNERDQRPDSKVPVLRTTIHQAMFSSKQIFQSVWQMCSERLKPFKQ